MACIQRALHAIIVLIYNPNQIEILLLVIYDNDIRAAVFITNIIIVIMGLLVAVNDVLNSVYRILLLLCIPGLSYSFRSNFIVIV